jgi:hypothetical protein
VSVLRNPRFWVGSAVVAIACVILSPGFASPRFPLGVRRVVASLAAGFAFVFIVATWVAAKQLSPRIALPLGVAGFAIAALAAADAFGH